MQEMLKAFATFRPDRPLDERVQGILEDYMAKYPAFAPMLSNIKLLEWNPSYAILVDTVHSVMFTIAANPLSSSSAGELQKASLTKELFTIRQKYLEWKNKLGEGVRSVASGQGLGGAVVSALADLEKDVQAHSFQPSGPGLVNPEKRAELLQAAGVDESPPDLTVYQPTESTVPSAYIPPKVDSVVMVAVQNPADSVKGLLPNVEPDLPPDIPKQLYTMVDSPDLKSITIDSASGMLRLETVDGPLSFDERFVGGDIATVFYFVYTHPELCVFSLDPADPKNPDGKYLKKVFYPPELNGTVLGDVLWKADWKLKQLDQGAWFDDSTNIRTQISDFHSGITFAKEDANSGVAYWRLWFVTDKVVFEKVISPSGVTLECKSVKIRVEARTLTPDPSTRSGFSDLPTPASAGCTKFGKYLTDHFDEVCAKVPEIKRLRQIVLIKSFAEWVRDMMRVPKEMLPLAKLRTLMPVLPPDYALDKVPKITNTVSEPFQNMIKRFVISGGVEISKAQIEEQQPSPQLLARHERAMKGISVFGAPHELLMEWLIEPDTAPCSDDEEARSSYMQLYAPRQCTFEGCSQLVPLRDSSRNGPSFPFTIKAPFSAYTLEGKVYCAEHHPRRCRAVKCQAEDVVILDKCLDIAGMLFHPQCFRCYICEGLFEGAKCSRDQTGFCHRECAEKRFNAPPAPPPEETKKVEEPPPKPGAKKGGKAAGKTSAKPSAAKKSSSKK